MPVTSNRAFILGGSWLTAGLYMNNFPTVQDMVLGSQPGWLLEEDLVLPGGAADLTALENVEYYGAIVASLVAKTAAGL